MDKEALQKKIANLLRLPKNAEGRLVSGIRSYFKSCKKQAAVVGVSGGVDSSVVCFLSAKALGAGNVFTYHMPYVQSEQDEKDLQQLVKMLGINYQRIDMRQIVDKFAETLKPTSRIASGNLRVRSRMITLYTFANQYNALVLGTGNRTEMLLGYFTKYGDGATDLLPIGNLYKSQVWELAAKAKLPQSIIEKVPSAGMWQGQTDEGEIGVSYREIDKILASHFDLKLGWEAVSRHFDQKKVSRIKELHEQSEHKRRMPDILKI